jgi:hypothetical protein
MMDDGDNPFHGSIIIHPSLELSFKPRQVGAFLIEPGGPGRLKAWSTDPDAWKLFLSPDFRGALEVLAWDLVWEAQVAVEFEPDSASRGNHLYLHSTIAATGNPKAGLRASSNFDLLQRIRDHLIKKHLAADDHGRSSRLSSDAAVLIALEHYVRGIITTRYTLTALYSVVETIENRLGGRHELFKVIPKSRVDKITSVANQPQYDQRHAPKDPDNVQPLPSHALVEAAIVAKDIITEYAKKVV